MNENNLFDVIGGIFRDKIEGKKGILDSLTLDDLIIANKDDQELLKGILNEIKIDDVISEDLKNEIEVKINSVLENPSGTDLEISNSEGILKKIHVKKIELLNALQKIKTADNRFVRIKKVVDEQEGKRIDPEFLKVQMDILRNLATNISRLRGFVVNITAEIKSMEKYFADLNEGKIDIDDKARDIPKKEFFKSVLKNREEIEKFSGGIVLKREMPCLGCELRLECDFVDEELNRGKSRADCLGRTWEVWDLDDG